MRPINILTLIVILFLSSCGDDYLTIAPNDALSDVTFFQTEADAQAALTGVYNRLRLGALWGGSEIAAYIEWGMTHDMYEMDRSAQRVQLWSLLLPPGNMTIRNVYRSAYQGIARANVVIDKVSEMENIDDNTRKEIVAQAKFARGSLYYILVKHYGGVPLIVEALESDADMNISRSSSEAIWNQVLADMNAAVNDLPLSWPSNEVGRVTRTAAWAFLAKAHIHLKNWNEVISNCENVVNSGEHELMSDFKEVFSYENQNNRELIFSMQHSQEPGQTSILTYRSAPRGGPGEYIGRAAWSNYVPNNQWVDDLEVDDEGVIKDLRYWATVIGPGEKHQYTEYVLPDPAPSLATRTGYILTKYWQGYWEPTSPVNVPVTRLPEVLLLYAEALNEVGRQEDAMVQVNLIRTRAGLEPKALNLSEEEVLEAILNEYRFEFMWEPVGGFSTLNRRGIFLEFLEEHFEDFESLNVDAKPWVLTQPILLPIPYDAYNVNSALEQNPHYPPF